MTAFPSTLFTV